MIRVTVRGVPEAQARPRTFFAGGRAITHSPKSEWYKSVYRAGVAVRPAVPMDGPVEFRAIYLFPRPKTVKGFWKQTRPDLDNIDKATLDALSKARWWVDDGRVCKLTSEKRYAGPGEEPGAEIMACIIP